MPGLLELFTVGLFGESFAVGPAVAAGGVTGVVTTGAGVGVGVPVLTGAGAAGVVTAGAGAFSTPLGIPVGVRAVDGRGAEFLGSGALVAGAG